MSPTSLKLTTVILSCCCCTWWCAGAPRALLDAPRFKWVTATGTMCTDACAKLGGTWRPVNSGDEGAGWAMCAGLIDMPGLGQWWLVGRQFYIGLGACNVACATKPCWKVPPGAKTEFDTVDAGTTNVYTAADGSTQTQTTAFPVKCACTNCVDLPCQLTIWKPASAAAGCPQPTIVLDAGESYPETVYSQICRGDNNYTGYVDRRVKPPVCRCSGMAAEQYSIWCAQRA
jgi:hypothetical protein